MRAVGGHWGDEALMAEELGGGCSFPRRPDTGRELLRQLQEERRVSARKKKDEENEGKRQSNVRCGCTKLHFSSETCTDNHCMDCGNVRKRSTNIRGNCSITI